MHKELERLGFQREFDGVLHITMNTIKLANRNAGQHFFSPGSMRFFSSRVSDRVYCGTGGGFFVTSEQFKGDPPNGVAAKPRSYTVRRFDPETCGVDTVGEFNGLTKSKAHTLARKLSEGTYQVTLCECGSCGQYHDEAWYGDCRSDANRFAGVEDFAARKHLPLSCIIEKDLEQQLEEDEAYEVDIEEQTKKE